MDHTDFNTLNTFFHINYIKKRFIKIKIYLKLYS